MGNQLPIVKTVEFYLEYGVMEQIVGDVWTTIIKLDYLELFYVINVIIKIERLVVEINLVYLIYLTVKLEIPIVLGLNIKLVNLLNPIMKPLFTDGC